MKGREGELRKVNVVYFISRDGKVEQPHLIRLQQLHSHGVHLRDVKRWLAALRGDNMPDSFAWSFKRRYKNGYVWQDLRDDDLITPFSDTEYILKGSELLLRSVEEDRQQRSTTTLDMSLSSAKTKNSPPISTPQESLPLSSSSTSSSPPPPQSQDTSDESSTHSAVVFKKQKEDGLNNISNRNSSSSSSRINNNNNNNKEHTSKNNDSRKKASRLLHNLIHCRSIDTSDSILRPVIGRQVSTEVTSQSRRSLGGGKTRSHDQQHQENSGHRYPNARKRSSDSEGRRSWRKGTAGEKTVRVVYRSAGPEPNCSQCGNNFKPDKLHAHMNSCKVLKAKRRKEKEQGHY